MENRKEANIINVCLVYAYFFLRASYYHSNCSVVILALSIM